MTGIAEAPSTPSDAALLATFLTGRDVACPQCAYNLRDLMGDRCPECGEQIALRVNAVEPRQAALITGLVALSAGLGLNVLLLVYWLMVIAGRRGARLDQFFVCNAGGALALGACLFVWLYQWRRLRRLPALTRWLLVIACFVLTFADLGVFIAYIR